MQLACPTPLLLSGDNHQGAGGVMAGDGGEVHQWQTGLEEIGQGGQKYKILQEIKEIYTWSNHL